MALLAFYSPLPLIAAVPPQRGQCHSNKSKEWKQLKGEMLLLSAFVSLPTILVNDPKTEQLLP
ncbi:hypothetical protein ccbrp13_23640 [Ktedonobacteria bacterium brp13]|nr:hypothetical protein ccbrp13_23640 [Ktedonobacteria bacterium brp13]